MIAAHSILRTNKYYKDLIVQYLEVYHSARKKDIRELLWDKLPDALSDQQKEYKIRNLLSALKRAGVIAPNTTKQPCLHGYLTTKLFEVVMYEPDHHFLREGGRQL